MNLREYTLTDEQLETLLEACEPVPYIVVGGIEPRSQQENANEAWRKLGDEMGFKWETVVPAHGKGVHKFLAEPLNPS